MSRMLGDDFARSMDIPLADIVYLQNRPIRLMPRCLRRRFSRAVAPERVRARPPEEREAARVADLVRR